MPSQMNDHTLDALKGWPSPYAVDHVAKAKAGVTVVAGCVVTLDANGEYVLGNVDTDAVSMFAFQNSTDPDVSNDGGDTHGGSGSANAWVPVAPGGGIMALVATGAYELESTEFDLGSGGTLLAINSVLTGDTGDGKLKHAVVYASHICGVVSAAIADNSHGVSSVKFFPVWLPPTP